MRRLSNATCASVIVAALVASPVSCAHESDEPYVNPIDSASILALYKAGYTNQKYKHCLVSSIHDYDGWRRTQVDFPQNAFETILVDAARLRTPPTSR